MVRLMSGLLRLRKKFQNSLLLDHVVKTAYQRGGRIGVPALFCQKNFDYPEKPLKYKHIRRISD